MMMMMMLRQGVEGAMHRSLYNRRDGELRSMVMVHLCMFETRFGQKYLSF